MPEDKVVDQARVFTAVNCLLERRVNLRDTTLLAAYNSGIASHEYPGAAGFHRRLVNLSYVMCDATGRVYLKWALLMFAPRKSDVLTLPIPEDLVQNENA
ncbi:hypothetical protein [Nitrosospira sp. Nsp18]|uniref:hypothetical protein n=1 Tax=Nitrosospira sp. Nsp18 TaxID=1855334 RepID=UPI000B89E37E|nr:hypothetical protein [Nitrosospira sp. Nsp18]